MNGFQVMAEAFHKAGDEKKARIHTFLASCNEEDFDILFDSSAFNDIAKGYLRLALRELEDEDEIEDETAAAVRRRFNLLFSELSAADVRRKLD